MKVFCFDIETVPHQNLPESVIPQFNPESVKFGNTKDPAKRQTKEDAERATFEKGLSKKMSLNPYLCEIVCFCGILFDTSTGKQEKVAYTGEPDTVEKGWQAIYNAYHKAIPILTYNGSNFDIPVLNIRAMDLGIPFSRRIYNELTRRYSSKNHIDLLQILSNWDRTRWQSLDFYLNRFSLGGKTGDGGQVYGMWKEGKHKEIEEYCMDDVLSTVKLFARVEGWIVEGIGVDDA